MSSTVALHTLAAAVAEVTRPAEEEELLKGMYHYFLWRASAATGRSGQSYLLLATTIQMHFPFSEQPTYDLSTEKPMLLELMENRKKKRKAKRKNDTAATTAGATSRKKHRTTATIRNSTVEAAATLEKKSPPKKRAATKSQKKAPPKTAPTQNNGTSDTTNASTSVATDGVVNPNNNSKPNQQPKRPKAVLSFSDRMRELEHFSAGHGHCRVPTTTTGLGRWVSSIRTTYRVFLKDPTTLLPPNVKPTKDTQLNQERIDRLNSLNFDWNLVELLPWETRYQHLVQYYQRFGNTRVPRTWKEDPQLGDFVHLQRKKFRSNELSAERKALLEKIDFEFQVQARNATFEERVEECKEFRRQHGHLNVPQPGKDRSAAHYSFRRWAERLREEMRKHEHGLRSSMTKTRIRQMNELGFDWGGKKSKPFRKVTQVPFDERLESLLEFKRENGHCRVPQQYPEDPSLGLWVKTLRNHYQRGMVPNERVEKLNSIGFEWSLGIRRPMKMKAIDDLEELSEASL